MISRLLKSKTLMGTETEKKEVMQFDLQILIVKSW